MRDAHVLDLLAQRRTDAFRERLERVGFLLLPRLLLRITQLVEIECALRDAA